MSAHDFPPSPWRWTVLAIVVAGSLAASMLAAQSSPTDLADLSLTELVRTHIIQRGAAASEDQPPWTVGYRFIRGTFEGYREGTTELSFEEMLMRFPVVPTRITQEVHLVNVSYRSKKTFTVSLILPFIEQTTDHIRRMGDPFTITSRGIGDPLVAISFRVWSEGRQTFSVNAGARLPLGSIDEKGDTPRGPGTQLPYTMQTGSGTWDLEPTLAYAWRAEKLTFGFQALGKVRLGRNDRDYSLGDRLLVSGWVSGHLGRSGRFEPSVKVLAEFWSRIDGADLEIDPEIAPVADARLSGGERVDLRGALKIGLGKKRLHAIELEGGVPIFQSLIGPQPERDWELTVGWKSQF